ncbi:MAG TPA: ATP-binding protein [Chthonomonadales bacterium]|nr:ATP-binding protein [Chthonomonadales bacterium]
MMTESELRALAADMETDRIERTISTRDTAKHCEAICAFANDLPGHRAPGYLLIGVKDDGAITNLAIDDSFLAVLGDLRSNGNILPLPVMFVERVRTTDGNVAVVKVTPSDQPPVRYKGQVYIRIGPRKGIASEQEERILSERRVSSALTFDALPCTGSSLDDIAEGIFLNEYLPQAVAREIIEENNRTLKEQLASLRFYDLRKECPTNGALLLFGLSPRDFMPGAYVQFLRVGGVSLADAILNEREIEGDLVSTLRELDAVVEAQLVQYPAPATSLSERIVEAFPKISVRELLLNAVMHRDYQSSAPLRLTWFDDRIEIQSPGGLFGVASPENFPRQTSYRNPVIAEAMKNIGYVNRYGRGVIRAQDALNQNGSPNAEFQFDPHYVLAVIRRLP